MRFITQVDRDNNNAISLAAETARQEKLVGVVCFMHKTYCEEMGIALVTNNFAGFNGCKSDGDVYLAKLSVPDQVQLSSSACTRKMAAAMVCQTASRNWDCCSG